MTPALAQWLPTVSHPLIAWGGVVAMAVPLVIHLLAQLRRTVMPWAAMRFVTEAIRRQRRRLRLEQWILLALRCLIVLLAGLAVAGLFHRGGLWTFAGGAPLRHVMIVLDDGLTSQVRASEGMTRFERLREEALAILDALPPGEPVAILRAARPVGAVVQPWATDHEAARRALKQLKPRFSRSDLGSAVEAARRHLGAAPEAAHGVVFLLSDMAEGAVGPPLPSPDATMEGRVQWFARRPVATVENHQVSAITPRRRVVVAEDGGRATMQFDVVLRRVTDVAGSATTELEVNCGTASRRVEHRWREGERVSAAIPVTLSFAAGVDAGPKIVRAALVPTPLEKLPADDQRHCLVEVRSKLLVGIVDAMERGAADAVPPWRWVAAALAPNAGTALRNRDRIEVVSLNASDLTESRCRDLDAIVLLRPDRVGAEGYAVLHRAARRGALVAVTPPALEQPALWAEAICRSMGLGWTVGLEAVPFDPPVPLAANLPVPGAFAELTADWESLLRPVRVRRLLAVDPGPDTAAVWLRLDARGRLPLLLAGEVGTGLFVVLTSALDQRWTNLTTKPLWLPLLHEMVRGAAGRRTVVGAEGLCGQEIVLDASWNEVRRLRRGNGPGPAEVPLRRGADTVVVEVPGVYRGEPEGQRYLTVNVDPEAGNTRAVGDAVLERWLGSLGRWQWWDPTRGDGMLVGDAPRREMAPSLLVLLLVLVVAEMCMARWFSHPPPRVGGPGREHGNV